uniref:FAD-binding FR-type domain-containing protein n=1 Tax=Grammatophora oceanica TaxID=210454 RepID=A0A7S1V6H5_9STRA
MRATTAFLATTPFSMFMFEELHDLHVYCGTTIVYGGIIHTIAHLLRWADQGNMFHLLFTDRSGISGAFIIASCILICFPMMFWKTIRFELRKFTHYLFYIFVIALCFHAPASAVPNGGFAPYVFSILLLWTMLDSLYVYIYMTEKIETTVFNVLPTGIQLTMDVSDRFRKSGEQGGYCYVCFPWIDKNQWHAFSLFENPVNPRQRQIFMQKTGDWTTAVHESLTRNTNRPIWVQGPFPSPYSNSIEYDNQLLVASGIGITPALSVIRRAHQEGARRPNLVWMVRDPHMLEFFMQESYLESGRGWTLVYYTGKQPFVANENMENQNSNICVIHGRPELESVIPAIIQGIETGKGLPEQHGPSKKQQAVVELAEELVRLEMKSGELSSQEKIAHLTRHARKLGFLFTDLVSALEDVLVDEHRHRSNLVVDDGNACMGAIDEEAATVATTASSQDASVCRIYRQDSILKQLPSTASRLSSRDLMKGSKKKNKYAPPTEKDLTTGLLKKRTDPLFTPWESQEGSSEFVKQMPEIEKERWGILYCGGAKILESKLAHIAEDLDLDFHTESFAW